MSSSSSPSKFARSDSVTSQNTDFIENEEGKKEFNVSKSRIIGLINWAHVAKLYLPFVLILVVIVLIVQIIEKIYTHGVVSFFRDSHPTLCRVYHITQCIM